MRYLFVIFILLFLLHSNTFAFTKTVSGSATVSNLTSASCDIIEKSGYYFVKLQGNYSAEESTGVPVGNMIGKPSVFVSLSASGSHTVYGRFWINTENRCDYDPDERSTSCSASCSGSNNDDRFPFSAFCSGNLECVDDLTPCGNFCCGWTSNTLNVRNSCTVSFSYLGEPAPVPICTEEQITTIDSAFYTGTHANPPRYELFKLPSGCPKTVVSVSSLPNSSSPAIDNSNQLNVAVSLDQNGNFVSEGWSNNYTQAIFVSAEQTQEQLGCESVDNDGYFVFCSEVSSVDSSTHIISTYPPPWNENTPRDTVIIYPPGFAPSSGSGNGGSSDSNGGVANLTSWENMLRRVIPQSVPNPIPALTNIYNFLKDNIYVELKKGVDFVIDLFEPQEYPEIPEYNFDVDDPTTSPEIELPPDYVVDTTMKYDTLPMEDEDLFPDLENEFKKKLDSIKTPDKDSIKSELLEKQKSQLTETFDRIVDKVNKAMEPVRQALPSGDGGCNCLADSFTSLSFSLPMGGGFTVGSMVNTAIICDNISVIRRIIIVIVAVACLGMILATLRR